MSNETLEALCKVRNSITEIIGAVVMEEVAEARAILLTQDESRILYRIVCGHPYLMHRHPELLERLHKVGGVAE